MLNHIEPFLNYRYIFQEKNIFVLKLSYLFQLSPPSYQLWLSQLIISDFGHLIPLMI